MENTNDLYRRLRRAEASQRRRRRLPVRGWLHEFLDRFVRDNSHLLIPEAHKNAGQPSESGRPLEAIQQR